MEVHELTVGPVAVLTVDRQHVRNALDPSTLRHLAARMRHTIDSGIRAIVLTGAGDTSFCSGMDLSALRSVPRGQITTAIAAFDAVLDEPERPPLIAAVNGAATGGGFEIVLRCDLVVAAEHATFSLPEVRRGMVPGGRGTLLPSRVPLAVALEIGLLGDRLPATRALDLGLVNRVLPGPEVVPAAIDLGRRIAENGPRAVTLVRKLMWTTAVAGAADSLAATPDVLDDPALSAETAEGVGSFLDKRRPRWA